MHNYVNTTNENDNQFEVELTYKLFKQLKHFKLKLFTLKIQYCRALYPFLAIDDTTLTVNEGDNFKIIQKHDGTFNHHQLKCIL